MNTNRNNQLARLHILLDGQGIDNDTKREIYASYGVASAAEMTDYQLRHLCARLEGAQMGPAPVISPRQDVGPETRRLRSQCLAIITGPYDDDLPVKGRGLGYPNKAWNLINPLIQQCTGAQLNQLSDGALMNFRRQLFKMRDSGWNWRDYAQKKGLNPNTGRPEKHPASPGSILPALVIPTKSKIVN